MKPNINEVKEEYQLNRIDELNINTSFIIGKFQLDFNNRILDLKPTNPDDLNTYMFGLRNYKSNLGRRLAGDDELYYEYLTNLYNEEHNIISKVQIAAKIYDMLNLIRDDKLAQIKYATYEGKTCGAISKYISNRIQTKDSNFILGIFGQVRSGKSMAGSRLAINLSTITGLPLEITDVVYSHDDWLRVKQKRREEGTLKGSVQIIDEGGNVADSQTWWDQDVREIVKHLRTQGFDNTCTIIISPMFGDIANKARGLFHAVMYPWKDWGRRYMEMTDTSNIDFEKNISSWKVDFLDVNPMTNKVYADKLKAALGDIIKVDALLPNVTWVNDYKRVSQEYKKVLQSKGAEVTSKKKIQTGDREFLQGLVTKILGDKGRYVKTIKSSGKACADVELIAIDLGIGMPTARKIKKKIEADLNG